MDTWQGTDLNDSWMITRKIDGVNLTVLGGTVYTTGGNTPAWTLDVPDGTYELFCGDWSTSMQALRSTDPPDVSFLYLLVPGLDLRLYVDEVVDPTAVEILNWFDAAVAAGYEGLVLWGPGGYTLKVKPAETHEVVVEAILEGRGALQGKMGALQTPNGRVGLGFTHEEREAWWDYRHSWIGTVIEVSCLGLTPTGKFRNASFIRVRPDKRA